MFQEKLQPFIDRHEEINRLLSSPNIATDVKKMTELSKEQSSLAPLVEKAREYLQVAEAIEENRQMLGDEEFGELARRSWPSWNPA